MTTQEFSAVQCRIILYGSGLQSNKRVIYVQRRIPQCKRGRGATRRQKKQES